MPATIGGVYIARPLAHWVVRSISTGMGFWHRGLREITCSESGKLSVSGEKIPLPLRDYWYIGASTLCAGLYLWGPLLLLATIDVILLVKPFPSSVHVRACQSCLLLLLLRRLNCLVPLLTVNCLGVRVNITVVRSSDDHTALTALSPLLLCFGFLFRMFWRVGPFSSGEEGSRAAGRLGQRGEGGEGRAPERGGQALGGNNCP